MDPRPRARDSLSRRLQRLVVLIVLSACSSGGGAAPLVVPSQPVAFSSVPGRGLASPWTIVPSADRATLLVLERAAGRVARIDVATGAITRLDSPIPNVPVLALAADPTDAAAFALVGSSSEPEPPLWEPEVSGSIYRLGIESGDWALVLDHGFSGTGFFVDEAGQGAYTWRNGIDRIDFVDGSRERLDGCADFPAMLIDSSGSAAYSQHVSGAGPHTSPHASLSRCDRTTGETTSGIVGYQQEAFALGCGGERLYRAQEHFDGVVEGVYATVLYEVLDAPTLVPLDSLDTRAAVSELRAPGGPPATSGDCASVWFGTPSGVFTYDTSARAATRIVEGGAAISHVAMGDRDGTVIVAGGTAASNGPFRVDVATAEFEGLFPGGAAFGDWMTALATSADTGALWIAVSPYGQSYYPPYRLGTARIDRVDLTTGLVTKGETLEDAHVWDLSACGEPGRVFAIGATWTMDGSEDTILFELRRGVLHPVRSMGSSSSADYGTLRADPGNGQLVMSHDCARAYVLGDHLYGVPVAGGAPRMAFDESGSAAALDPRQDLLVVTSQLSVFGIDLRNGARYDLAYLTEPALDLAVTREGKVVWTGRTSLGLGVIDLVGGSSARLWEGAGIDGLQ